MKNEQLNGSGNGRLATSIYEPKVTQPAPRVVILPEAPADEAQPKDAKDAPAKEASPPPVLFSGPGIPKDVLASIDQFVVFIGPVSSGKTGLLTCLAMYVATASGHEVRTVFASRALQRQLDGIVGGDLERTLAHCDMAQVFTGELDHEVLVVELAGRRVALIAVHGEAIRTQGALDATSLARALSTRGVATVVSVNPFAASLELARRGIPTIAARLQESWSLDPARALRAAVRMTIGLTPEHTDRLVSRKLDHTLTKVRLSLDPTGALVIDGDRATFERDVEELVRAASARSAMVISTLESAATSLPHKAVIVTRRDVLELVSPHEDVNAIYARFDGGNAHVKARATVAGVLSTADDAGRLMPDGPGAEQDGAAILAVVRHLASTAPRRSRWWNPFSWRS